MTYSSPAPPLTGYLATAHRVGTYDRDGTPQDVLEGEIVGGPARAATTPTEQPRSVLFAMVLAALAGPLGLLYSSRLGAGFTAAVFLALFLPLSLAGIGGLAVLLVFPWCVVWAALATVGRNAGIGLRARLAATARSYR